MKWLAAHVHPLVADSTLRHSSVPLMTLDWVPFPEHVSYDGFVGQQFDDEGKAIWP